MDSSARNQSSNHILESINRFKFSNFEQIYHVVTNTVLPFRREKLKQPLTPSFFLGD